MNSSPQHPLPRCLKSSPTAKVRTLERTAGRGYGEEEGVSSETERRQEGAPLPRRATWRINRLCSCGSLPSPPVLPSRHYRLDYTHPKKGGKVWSMRRKASKEVPCQAVPSPSVHASTAIAAGEVKSGGKGRLRSLRWEAKHGGAGSPAPAEPRQRPRALGAFGKSGRWSLPRGRVSAGRRSLPLRTCDEDCGSGYWMPCGPAWKEAAKPDHFREKVSRELVAPFPVPARPRAGPRAPAAGTPPLSAGQRTAPPARSRTRDAGDARTVRTANRSAGCRSLRVPPAEGGGRMWLASTSNSRDNKAHSLFCLGLSPFGSPFLMRS